MKIIKCFGTVIFGLASASGCATAMPPQDLVTARADYDLASHGAAASFDPTDLHDARQSLAVAEQSFVSNGASRQTIDLAYVADRNAQTAQARGLAMQANQQQQQTLAGMHAAQTATVQATSAQLGRANQQIALQGEQLRSEHDRRTEAEARAARAAADLAAFASVKQEPRGMVITLSGSVLFASNESNLLPSAQVKLNEVGTSLTQQDSESKITVEGHTDSQGTATYNQDLSQRRAQSVRDYLVSRGIAADRVTAQGFGLSRPIADNASAEGRADNRRVEIVVQPAAAPAL
jgi:outer membrane protein OmpA-like peptidoglycan-associated protein